MVKLAFVLLVIRWLSGILQEVSRIGNEKQVDDGRILTLPLASDERAGMPCPVALFHPIWEEIVSESNPDALMEGKGFTNPPASSLDCCRGQLPSNNSVITFP